MLLDREEYVSKLTSILSDQTKFTQTLSEKDKTEHIEQQISKCLKTLREEGVITETTYESIRPTGSTIPRLYGLPKIHKPGVPLRPILSMTNSPYHSAAQWLVEILEPVRQRLVKHSLKDTFQFVRNIQDINVTNRIMFSLDVQSLFTNVPLVETIDYICQFVQKEDVPIAIPVASLRELLFKCTFNVQFLFDGTLYRQKDGVAMGSPLGPLLADIFLATIENDKLQDTINRLTQYHRYVDDIFCIADDDIDIDALMDQFNRAHKLLTFTIEKEVNNQLAFLDVRLTRRIDGSLQRDVYRRKTWNGQYTNFKSFVPIRQKQNLVRCITFRARNICSDDTLEQELAFIKNIFRENGYPDRFIEKNMRPVSTEAPVTTVARKKLFICLPFNGDPAAEAVTRRITSALKATFYAADLRCTFRSRPILSVQNKDKLPQLTSSMVIYSFRCICDAFYVGRTTRHLSTRIREHLPRWLNHGGNGSISSAVLSHLVDTGHQVNPQQAFRVLLRIPPNRSKAVRSRMLATAEAISIRRLTPNLCVQKKFVQTLQLPWPSIIPTQHE